MTAAVSTDDAPATRLGVLRRGLALSPELFTGLAGTLGLAVLATAGRVARSASDRLQRRYH